MLYMICKCLCRIFSIRIFSRIPLPERKAVIPPSQLLRNRCWKAATRCSGVEREEYAAQRRLPYRNQSSFPCCQDLQRRIVPVRPTIFEEE